MFGMKRHRSGRSTRLRAPAGACARPAASEEGFRQSCRHQVAAGRRHRGRVLILGALVSLLPVVPALAGTVPAQAGAAPGAAQTLMNVATSQCLGAQYDSVSGATNLSTSVQYCSGLDGDDWRLIPVDQSGDYQIVVDYQDAGEQCLDVGYPSILFVVPCQYQANAQWHVTPDPAGGSSAPSQIALAGTTKCLRGTGGTNIQLTTCDGDTYEQWQRTQITGFKTTSELRNGANGLCLASDPGSTASPVQVTGCVPFGAMTYGI
jgi:hypothetical protein